ncbi:MAG: hypothetical protein ABI650_06410, partial [Dokdonella sp.]
VTVQPGTIAVGDCPYQGIGGDQVPPGHDGVTIANRQSVSFSSYGFPGGSSGNRDVTTWVGLNGAWPTAATPPLGGTVAEGFGFPGAWYNNTDFTMQRGRFIALKFRAPVNSSWYGRTSEYTRYGDLQGATSAYSMSVSKCPGQFRAATGAPVDSRCVLGPASKNGIGWTIVNPNVPYLGEFCPLKAGETYYFNMFAADPAGDLSTSLCAVSTCGYKVGSQNIF